MKVNYCTSFFAVNLSKHQVISPSLSKLDHLFERYSFKRSFYAENARADRRFANWLNVRNFISIMKNSKSLSKTAKKLLFIYLLASQANQLEGTLLDFSEFRDEINESSKKIHYKAFSKECLMSNLPTNNPII